MADEFVGIFRAGQKMFKSRNRWRDYGKSIGPVLCQEKFKLVYWFIQFSFQRLIHGLDAATLNRGLLNLVYPSQSK